MGGYFPLLPGWRPRASTWIATYRYAMGGDLPLSHPDTAGRADSTDGRDVSTLGAPKIPDKVSLVPNFCKGSLTHGMKLAWVIFVPNI